MQRMSRQQTIFKKWIEVLQYGKSLLFPRPDDRKSFEEEKQAAERNQEAEWWLQKKTIESSVGGSGVSRVR